MYRSSCYCLFLILLLTEIVFSLNAQTLSSPFITKTYTSQDGLPHSYIYGILQDNKGYLWVGTRYGLSRFDGQNFSGITFNDEVKNIPLGTLIEDEGGRLSILSGEELYYPDNKKKLSLVKKGSYFPVFFLPGNRIKEKDGWWTFAKDGIYPLNGTAIRKITPIPESSKKVCRQIFETDSGWYYNFLNEFLFAGKNGEIKNIGKLLPSSRFIVVMGFRDNQFYLYTDKGIYTYSNNRIRTLFEKQLSGKHIYAVYRDTKNRTWIGTDEDGILISQPGQEEILSYSIKLSHNLISGFYEDKEENMWIAGFEGLVKVQDKQFELFSPTKYPFLANLNLVTKDKNGMLYFFSETNGISRRGKESFLTPPNDLFKGQLIDALCLDKKDNFWCISRQNKLLLFSNKTKKIITDSTLASSGDLQPDIVYDYYREKIWVPGDNLLSGDENGFKIFKDSNNKPIQYPKRILAIGNGKLIIATAGNELMLIKQNNSTRKITISKNLFPEKFYRFFSDSSGNIWIAYPGTGLLQCRLLNDSSLIIVNQFTRENGLNNDVIQSMTFDKQHRIWLSTMAGITIIDFKDKAANSFPVYLFGNNEGIPASGLEYGRLLCDDNGDIWYSTQNSLMKFRVNEMQFNNTPPHVSIEDIRLNMNETNWYKYSDSLSGIFQIPVNPVMNYYENTITVTFKAATMTNAENIQYSYMLSGLNDNWSNSSTGNTITFSKLKPGNYSFFVRARKNNFDWSTPALFSFSIRKPFWQQWWFTALIILTCLAVIYGLYRIRINQLNKERQIRDQIASDLHDDLGSTLNSVKVYANVASIEKDNKQYLEKIKESIQEAISGVRDIIWVLDEKKDSLEHLFTRINQFANPVCDANHIKFIQQVDNSLYNHQLHREEKRNLYMIIKEVINNSIKYAECENISLIAAAGKKNLQINITDDGKGFDVKMVMKGNGMHNILKRAHEIHYHIEINSIPGKGTTVNLEKT